MLNHYDELDEDSMSEYLDTEFIGALQVLATIISGYVGDQKNFQGNINHLSQEERTKVRELALEDARSAKEALSLEFSHPEKSGKIWQKVLGKDFPVAEA